MTFRHFIGQVLFGSAVVLGGVNCGDGGEGDGPDLSASTFDMAGAVSVVCGPNTALNATTNKCEIDKTACQGNTVFDVTTFTCKEKKNFGTLVFSSNFYTRWTDFYYQLASPPDGGSAFKAIGDFTTITALTVPDTELMFLKTGVTMGMVPPIPVHWETGAISSTPHARTTQLTLAEVKKCGGSWAIYKDPPSGKKNYNMVIDLANCPPDLFFSVWNVYSNDALVTNRILGAPTGGLPAFITTNLDGSAHWEREMDPNVWTKTNAVINGNAHNPLLGQGVVPDLTTFPNASMWPDLTLHNTGQSNGNPGFCERDSNNLCVTPPSFNVLLPGQGGVEKVSWLTSSDANGSKPVPLSMIQPY